MMVMMITIMKMMMEMIAISNEIKVHLFLERSEIFIWKENHHTVNLGEASIKFCQLTITYWIIIASTKPYLQSQARLMRLPVQEFPQSSRSP